MVVEPVHTSIKGRTRYKVKGLYRSESLKEYLEFKLSKSEAVFRVSASSLTGKVLLYYNSGNTVHTIASLIESIITDYRQQDRGGIESTAPQPYLLHRESPGGEPVSGGKPGRVSGAGNRIRQLFRTEEQPVAPWHRMKTESVLESLNSSKERGLSRERVKENLKRYGPNLLPEAATRSRLSIFAGQFKTLPVALLTVAAGISVVTGGLADAVVIMGVVVLNATIGFSTENEAERTISSLKDLVKPTAYVIREGEQKEIIADEVVPGDLLVLKPGSYIAADSRVIEAVHLNVDESALTGESMPVVKTPSALTGDNISVADKSNMVYMGTLVTGGQGLAVVVATGIFTEIGRLQTLVGEATAPQTPLEKQLNRVGNQLVVLCGIICGIVFGVGLLRGYGVTQMLRVSISLAAAAVPEGLPTVAVTTMAFGMQNMRRHHVLMRRLGAVETLGCVQTICFDKTGTITHNRMSVVSVYAGMRRFKIRGEQFLHQGEPIVPRDNEELSRLIQMGVLCSETRLDDNGCDERKSCTLKGSPTENALVQMALDAGIEVKALRKSYPLLGVNHRSENRLFMSTVHTFSDHGQLVALKGSPLEVLDMCEWYIKDGKKFPLTEEDRQTIQLENERMAGKALRVLGMAYAVKEEDEVDSDHGNGFIWLGLVGMADPIRDGVRELIDVFHEAGIETVMITGDQTPTAYSVGKVLNLGRGEQIEILDSSYLGELDPATLRALAGRVSVFARVSPAHKLQIVQALQQAGRVVAMTGDGINDGPALKAADIGIAMGHTGTDIAREVADVVLEEDNLETLVLAVRDGRAIYENIRKSVHFFLTTNVSEIMVTFVSIAGGLGHPLNAMQLLWINTISDIFPGLGLAMEAPEPDVLARPPRDPQEPIIKQSDFKRLAFESASLSAGALGAYGYGLMRYGMGAKAGTMAFQSLAVAQLLHAVSCRSETHSILHKERLAPNRYLTIALGGSFAVQALSMLIPGLRRLLGLTPIGPLDAAVIGGGALLPFVVNETTKR